jgi:hypothetical protein
MFVAQFSPLGAHQWSYPYGSSSGEYPNGVAVDGNYNVIVTGSFADAVDFGGGVLTALDDDVFLVKYNSSGAHQWSQRFGSGGGPYYLQSATAVAVDPSNNIVITGYFEGGLNLGGLTHTTLGVGSDIFLARYNSAGTFGWSQKFGGPGPDFGWSVATGSGGDVILTGTFGENVDFGGGLLESVSFKDDIFLVRFTSAGSHQWSASFGDFRDTDVGRGVTVDKWGNILATGRFAGTVDFGGGPLTSPGSNTNVYVAKFGLPPVAVEAPQSRAFLGPLFPNPFNPSTRITFNVLHRGPVALHVYNVDGARIATLVDRDMTAGPHEVLWDGRNRNGETLPSGVYFVRLIADGFTATRKAVLLK